MRPFVKDKVRRKLKGWKYGLLTEVGREFLIKSFAAAIPTYSMTYFNYPLKWCNGVNSMIGRFLWGQRKEELRVH